MNRKLVYATIKDRRETTRSELAHLLGLTKNTINSIVDEMVAGGYVRETGLQPQHGAGRRAVGIELYAARRQAIGIQVAGHELQAVVTDLYASPLKTYAFPLRDRTPAGMSDTIAYAVEQIAAAWPKVGLLGVGVGVPALLNPSRERVVISSHLGWREVDLLPMLQDRMELPVILDNAVKMAAIGELWHGIGKETGHLAYCSFGAGVGCGIVVGGGIVRGEAGAAGELGHIVVEPDGPPCSCGNRGCLEAVAGLPSLFARLAPHTGIPAERMSAAQLAELMRQGNADVAQELRRVGAAIGQALASVVNLLNPKVIVCDGPLMEAGETLLPIIASRLKEKALSYHASQVILVKSALYPLTGAIGAAAAVIADFEKRDEPRAPMEF